MGIAYPWKLTDPGLCSPLVPENFCLCTCCFTSMKTSVRCLSVDIITVLLCWKELSRLFWASNGKSTWNKYNVWHELPFLLGRKSRSLNLHCSLIRLVYTSSALSCVILDIQEEGEWTEGSCSFTVLLKGSVTVMMTKSGFGKTWKKEIWVDLRWYSVFNRPGDAKGKARFPLRLRH